MSLSTIGSVCTPPADALKAPGEWLLKQSAVDVGDVLVYISPDAVKIENLRMGYAVLTKAPDWQVYCYRAKDKKYWTGCMKDFNGILLRNPFAVPKFNQAILHQVAQVQYCNVPCTEYRPNPASYTLLGANTIATDTRVSELLCRYFFVNKMKAVPLARRNLVVRQERQLAGNGSNGWLDADLARDLRKGPEQVLWTTAVQTKTYSSEDFALPKEMTRLKDIGQIGMSNDTRDKFSDLFGEFGNVSRTDKNA
ncbi:MAG: hypothetical protein KGS72_16015, partial [Cyanobacteria bacterium REEB67]|nr:hypothetical protein [Cyanobacteria bacterium REEB67]